MAVFSWLGNLSVLRLPLKTPAAWLSHATLSDEGYRNTFHWCVSFGVVVVLLTTGTYLVLALTTEPLPYYYAYLSGALIPISPWAARIALDPYRQLVTCNFPCRF
jgi:hypothetical protein